jgi:signal transduction histidine kinase
MSSKEIELRHYVEIAKSAIAPFYDAPVGTPAEEERRQKQASTRCSNSISAPTAISSPTRCTALH